MTIDHDVSESSHLDPHLEDAPEKYESARNWLLTLPTGLLLLAALFFGTSAFIHGQLLAVGGQIWDNYSILRADLDAPTCNPDINIDQRVKEIVAESGGGGGGLLDMGPADPEAVRQSLTTKRNQCRQTLERYEYYSQASSTLTLQAYRFIERSMAVVATIGSRAQVSMLILLILFGGLTAVIYHEQIALRFPKHALDYRISAAVQFLVMLFLGASALRWVYTLVMKTGDVFIYAFWASAFAAMMIASVYRFFKIPDHAEPGGSVFHALLTVPLYCYLGIVGALYFLLVETYLPGPVIQLHMMMSFADLYTAIGLFVWIGMMLKHTRLAELIFEVLHAWRLRPEFIVLIVVILAAYPTAYTGASGIFVLAAGAVIYQQLRIGGAYRQLSIAATAMSGSLGVVLAPCLMIVIIAALNRQVTTDQLYGWGVYVYILTAVLFTIYVYFTRKSTPGFEKPAKALPAFLRALVPLIPYALIGVIVVMIYSRLIGVSFNEFSAPVILPVAMLFLLLYDRIRAGHKHRKALKDPSTDPDDHYRSKPAGFMNALRAATADTSMLTGALLTLMVLSIVFGGVAGRSGVMGVFPEDLGNVWLAMAILLVILVIMGMIMDPYGAIILVSATIAPIAYSNGIEPIHFWMLVLLAFELGYLTPPVALNQLLTRMVIGQREIDLANAEVADDPSFYRRYESWILPLMTLFTALMIVAWGPLIYKQFFS